MLQGAYLEPSQTSKDGAFFANIVRDFMLLTISAKKLHRSCSIGFQISLWLLRNSRQFVVSLDLTSFEV